MIMKSLKTCIPEYMGMFLFSKINNKKREAAGVKEERAKSILAATVKEEGRLRRLLLQSNCSLISDDGGSVQMSTRGDSRACLQFVNNFVHVSAEIDIASRWRVTLNATQTV